MQLIKTEVELNNEKISLGEESDFIINEDNVDGELCQTGKLLCYYGNLAAELQAQASTAEAELEAYEANLGLTIRGTSAKFTEGSVKETIRSDSKRKELLAQYIKYQKYAKIADNLFKSQQKRADCLISLAYKQRTEIAKTNY